MVRVHIPGARVARGNHGGINGSVGREIGRIAPSAAIEKK